MSSFNKFFPLNQRWFMRSAALAGGALLTASLSQFRTLANPKAAKLLASNNIFEELNTTPNPDKPLKVVILGAGIAGLVAAYELEKRGHTAVILEAEHSHIGGRLRTLRFEDGLYGEAGAMRIPKSHHLTRHYINQLGLQLRPFVMGNPEGYYYMRGQRIRAKNLKQLNRLYRLKDTERNLSVDDLWAAAMYQPLAGLSEDIKAQLFAAEAAHPIIRKYDDLTLLEMCYAAGLSDEAIEMLAVAYNFDANRYNSALSWMRDDALWTAGFDEIVGGTDTLAKTLAEKLQAPPRLGCEVVALERNDSGKQAIALYREKGEIKRETGDFVLCTIPFPVLARIDAPFSGPKWRVIRNLGYDSATKTLAICNRRFWETEDGIYGGGTFSDTLASTFYPANNATAKDPAVSAQPAVMLASYSWGSLARRQASLSPSDRHTWVKQELAKLHPQTKQNGVVQRLVSWAWDTHPWSGGAYALLMPSQQRTFYKDVVAPEGRIHFAGEHTSTDHAWIQGAIHSSLRAVQAMLVEG